jgi:UDP-N-acetylglucosamine:LPS N-acetylglucosamine transferase
LPHVESAHQVDDAKKLYEAGAAYVIMPHFLGARHAVHIIRKAKTNKIKYQGLRSGHLKRLGVKFLVE